MFVARKDYAQPRYVALHHVKIQHGTGRRLVDPCPSVNITSETAAEILPALAAHAGLPPEAVAILKDAVALARTP